MIFCEQWTADLTKNHPLSVNRVKGLGKINEQHAQFANRNVVSAEVF